MRFAENQLEHQITDLKLNVQELNTSIMDISKETLLEYNNEKKYVICLGICIYINNLIDIKVPSNK